MWMEEVWSVATGGRGGENLRGLEEEMAVVHEGV